MAGKTYLIVKEPAKFSIREIVDMAIILNDLTPILDDMSLEKSVIEDIGSKQKELYFNTLNLEFERLREKYPLHEIKEVFADEFHPLSPEIQYIKENRPKEVFASEILKRKTVS